MRLINTDGIEESLLNAIANQSREYVQKKQAFLDTIEHDKEISVTTLAQPIQAVQLKKRHWDKVVKDARQCFSSLLGDLFHKMAELYAKDCINGDQVEQRYGRVVNATIGGKHLKVLVHGAADRFNLERGYIKDYKVTSMAAMNYEKSDYIQQLNLLRFLMKPEDKERINYLSNIFVFANFRFRDVLDGRSPQPTFTKEIFYEVWPDERCQEVLRTRLLAHLQAELLPDESLPECTREELWFSRSGFRVRHKTKAGEWSKLSSGWAPDRDEALLLTKKKTTEWRLEETIGKPKRCEWCDAASVGCRQFLAMQNQQPNTEEDDQD